MISELTDLDWAAAVCTRALDLPEDAAEAAVSVRRLADPPAGRQVVRLHAGDTGVGFGSIDDRDPRIGHVDLLAVDPAARQHGIGRSLLAAIEDRLVELGATQIKLGANPPCYVWPGIDVRYTPAVCAARRLGYELVDTAWNMTVDLSTVDTVSTDEDRLAEAGIEVRPGEESVVPWVRATWHDGWAWEVAQSIDRSGAGVHVAWRDGEPLGFAAYGGNRPSWFGPMGTAPAAEGLGVGRVLLRRCLVDQRDAGLRTAQIAWAGPLGFYSRAVGARVERIFWTYAKKLKD
jgi:GNAT superfamily N-acetyltransferase